MITIVLFCSIWQNVHTGQYPDCEVEEVCGVQAVALSASTIRCIAGCNYTSSPSINISVNSPASSSLMCDDTIDGYTMSDCVQFTLSNGLGLHSYSCMAQSLYSDIVTTPRGPPADFENDIYASCDQTSCKICVQELQLTDDISSYTLQVEHNATGMSIATTDHPFQASNGCVFLTSLNPGSTISYRVIIRNGVGSMTSLMRMLQLLDGEAGPVRSISVQNVTNSTIQLSWQEPENLNGTLIGYSVMVNGISERMCSLKDTSYVVKNLLPFTNYSIKVRACNNHGESNQYAEVTQQTDCGFPSTVRNSSVMISETDLTFSWTPPDRYNGDISREQYQVTLECFKVGQNGTSHSVMVFSRSIMLSTYLRIENSPQSLCCAKIQAVTSCNDNTLLGIPHVLCERTADVVPDIVVDLIVSEASIGINSFVIQWDHPINYDSPGLNYRIQVSDQPIVHTSQQFLFVGGLTPCTLYNVVVIALNSALQPSGTNMLMVKTRPALPPTPTDLSFSYDGVSDNLILTWNIPNIICSDLNILSFNVAWTCDGFQEEMNYNTSSMNITLNLDVNFGLCIATVQSCDDGHRCSAYSGQAVIEATRQPPPTLNCYSYSELLDNVRVAFLFPSPFITSQLRIKWNLVNLDNDLSIGNNYEFNSSSTNVVDLATQSNARYLFNISACNVYGCGNPCFSNFSTSAIPSPPDSINVSDIQSSSVLLSWKHSNTRQSDFSYAISISSACPDLTERYIDSISSTSYRIQNLCPNDNYSVVILAADSQVNQKSVFSSPILFTTNSGVPSAPLLVVVSRSQSKGLYVTWHPPRYLNSQLSGFLVKWVKHVSCESDSDATVMVKNDQYSHEFNDFQEDINEITVCVQAVSLNSVSGPWGSNFRVMSQGLIATEPNCNTLIIVIVFVVVTALLAIVMFIALLCSLIQYCKQPSHHSDKPLKCTPQS